MKKIISLFVLTVGFLVANAQSSPTDITKVLKFTNDNNNMGTIAYGKPT